MSGKTRPDENYRKRSATPVCGRPVTNRWWTGAFRTSDRETSFSNLTKAPGFTTLQWTAFFRSINVKRKRIFFSPPSFALAWLSSPLSFRSWTHESNLPRRMLSRSRWAKSQSNMKASPPIVAFSSAAEQFSIFHGPAHRAGSGQECSRTSIAFSLQNWRPQSGFWCVALPSRSTGVRYK